MGYFEFLKRTLTVFGLAIFFIGVWHLRNVLMLAFLAVIIALSLSIPVGRLQKLGLSRGFAITLTLSGVISAIILFVVWLLPILIIQVADIVDDLPIAFDQVIAQYETWLMDQNEVIQNVLPSIESINDEQIENAVASLVNVVSPVLADAGNVLAGAAINAFFLFVISFFLLIDPKDYVRGMVTLVPPNSRERALEMIVELRQTLTAWLTALAFSITITTILVWAIIGGLLSVPNGLALGVIAGVMTLIPNIGAIVPLIPIALFTVADDPAKLIWVLLAYVLIQQAEANFLTPSIVKRELNIPAALVLLFQIVATILFGFLGILLAVPLLATIITLVREVYVYDVLGQRGVTVDVAFSPEDGLKLVTEERDDSMVKVMTQTFKRVEPIEGSSEDTMD